MGSVEIDVVNKNLLDINKITQNTFYWQEHNQIVSNPNWNMSDYIKASKNDNFTISFKLNNPTSTQINYSYYNSDKELIGGVVAEGITTTTKSFTIIDNRDIKYIRVGYRNDKGMYDIQLKKGLIATNFVEHQSQSAIMPIQQEMLTGDYVADVEHHEWGKIESYNGENITTNYISTTGELSTGATVYYKLTTPVDLELTSEQKAIRDTKLYTYKNITNIDVSNELASIDVTYKKDLETMFNNIIKQIPSNTNETTET